MKLQSVLAQLSVHELKTIAASIGLKLPYYYLYKQDIGEQIARHLTDPSVIGCSNLQARAAGAGCTGCSDRPERPDDGTLVLRRFRRIHR